MKVILNGEHLDLGRGLTVAELVQKAAESSKGVAVAVNAEVVPRSAWSERRLAEGDSIELLKAAQGG